MGDPILLSELTVPTDRTPINREFFNKRFSRIVSAINGVSSRVDGFQSIEDTLLQSGLERLDLSLGPLMLQLQQAADQGFLMCRSSSANTLIVGNVGAWVITSEGGRDLFQPTPFLCAMDNADSNHWAVLGSVSYDRETGILQGSVVFVNGGTVACSDWTIAASPATVPAMATMLNDAATIRDEINGSIEGIGADIAAIEAALAALEGSGAVVSVAGKAGVVVLELADVYGLISALAAKLDVSTATSLLIAKAPLASPEFTGTPRSTSPSTADNSTRVATTAWAWSAVASLAASQAQAEAGLDNATLMSPLRTAQAIRALLATALTKASQAEAEAGADDAKYMTPLKVKQAVNASVISQDQVANLAVSLGLKANTSALGTAAYEAATSFAPAGSYQTADAKLTAIAGLTAAADRLAYFTGVATAAIATLTAFARTLLDDTDAPTARATLGLGDIATRNAADFSAAGALPLTGGVMTGPVSVTPTGGAAKGNSSTGTKTFNYSEGNVQSITNTADHTWAFSNWPPGGTYAELMIICTNAGAHVITFPTIRWLKGDGSYSTNFADLGVTLQASGKNFFMIATDDGGTVLYGRVM
jgi:hypothetical protein